ncbi:hypothetical protein [Anthocerotibacter panamensis]|uniref:hypothetical protein n=1 Tax=Anthocerotibacter panamensis TaxID=2857077 RepID=UPI001C406144|nr:hypothetical protein [Anthocerotibacter panamensis]
MNPDLNRVQVQPDTRNHQGFFIAEEEFFLVEETPSGWARICSDAFSDGYMRCHLVNPDDLRHLR